MGSLAVLLLVYILGGLTFIPLLFGLLILHAYLFLPFAEGPSASGPDASDNVNQPTDDQSTLQTGTDVLAEKFHRTHESDVAAGYFTVCREYVPGGINGKPPERTTPAGEVITPESPSVYQSMYRSIFERKNPPTLDPGKANGRPNRKGRNVFYVVLRHGHLMLYDDSGQMEVRYVISLSHYDVSIYSGEDNIPEGELWIKRNAIRLTKRAPQSDIASLQTEALPFYIFSDNPSEKEDLYFAILKNLEKLPDSPISPPTAQQFPVKHMVNLVKRLHSSEENLQTRWFNALVGRVFLALYQTSELENHIWTKITKKISRVQKPNFITSVVLRKIDAGEGAPLITNPRLKDLTVDGNCCVEADVTYSGNFRLEIAATARIDFGQRFKAREVDLVLAVLLKRLKGHILVRFKPPPSNRAWISFETMPEMEMAIEPIVSSRQITYGIILRAIESRIREVVGETLVQPFWDDIPFLDTTRQHYRGGIWQEASTPAAGNGNSHEHGAEQTISNFLSDEASGKAAQVLSMPSPSVPLSPAISALDKKASPPDDEPAEIENIQGLFSPRQSAVSLPLEHPLTSDVMSVENLALELKHDDVDAISSTVNITPHPQSPSSGSIHHRRRQHSSSSHTSQDHSSHIRPRADSILSKTSTSPPFEGTEGDLSGFGLRGSKTEDITSASRPRSITSLKSAENKQTMASLGNAAAAAAKKWGWNVLGLNDQKHPDSETAIPDHPIGRGRPLPPPGTPLPPPEKSSIRVGPMTIPRRKPLASQLSHEFAERGEMVSPNLKTARHRKSSSSTKAENSRAQEELLVIRAPAGSEPGSPAGNEIVKDGNELSIPQTGLTQSSFPDTK